MRRSCKRISVRLYLDEDGDIIDYIEDSELTTNRLLKKALRLYMQDIQDERSFDETLGTQKDPFEEIAEKDLYE